MPSTTQLAKFIRFASFGYIVLIFERTRDAKRAQSALLEDQYCSSDVELYHSEEVLFELNRRLDTESIGDIASIASESVMHGQLLGYARQGCCFLNALASTRTQQDAVRRCIQSYHPKRIQCFHVRDIEQLMNSYSTKLVLDEQYMS